MKKTNRYMLLSLIFFSFLSGCGHKEKYSFPGYIEGKFTYISAYYSGILEKINVNPGDFIKQGQPLFTLEPFPQHAELMEANARVQQAIDEKEKHEANYLLQKSTHNRNLLLFKKEVISKEELEKSTDEYNSAVANKQVAEANLQAEKANQSKASWASKQKTVLSPLNALVFDTYYSVHEKVSEDRPVLSLLVPQSIKVIFYIPEPLLSTLKLNQIIDVSFDGASQLIPAKISYISTKEEYTPPVIFSEMEREKLVFRVEALPVDTDNWTKIHPGQPVTVTLREHNSQVAK